MISERKCHWGALNVHGLTCKQFRGIAEVVKEFMEYIANEMMAAHKNAIVIVNIRQN